MNTNKITNYSKHIRAALHSSDLVPLGDVSGDDQKRIFTARPPAQTPAGMVAVIDAITVVTETGITADNTNYWSIQVANMTQSNNLFSAAQTTKAASVGAITADAAWVITPDQNATLYPNDVIEFQATKGGSPSTMAETSVTVHWHWEEA